MKLPILIFSAFILSSCQNVETEKDYKLLSEELGKSGAIHTDKKPYESLPLETIDEILKDGLTLNEATSLALTNNQTLHSEFLGLGIEKAEQVQSFLLSNPSFDLSILLPEGGGRSNLAYSLTQNISEVWRLPIKKEIAEKNVKAALYKIVSLTNQNKNSVKQVFLAILSVNEQIILTKKVLKSKEDTFQAISKKQALGAGTAQELSLAKTSLLKTQLQLSEIEKDKLSLLSDLKVSLGINENASFALVGELNKQYKPSLANDKIKDSLTRHPLLVSLAYEIEAVEAQYNIEAETVFKRVELGWGRERLERRGGDGPGINNMSGPLISIELPIFDQNQAVEERAYFHYLQTVKQFKSAYFEIHNKIHSLQKRQSATVKQIKLFNDALKPEFTKRLRQSEQAMKNGNITLLRYLNDKEEFLELEGQYFDLILDYNKTQTKLDELTAN